MLINCDIGEYGIENSVDNQLMQLIDIANIACGGHAGDKESSEFFKQMSSNIGIQCSAHLSYPDRPNFGRKALSIGCKTLLLSLDEQLAHLPEVKIVKFHGALYNESINNPSLAETLSKWLMDHQITSIITMPDSELACHCHDYGIIILREAFAERRYCLGPDRKRLLLCGRDLPDACIDSVSEAIEQSRELLINNRLLLKDNEDSQAMWAPLVADTICIHSDSQIALNLASELRVLIDSFRH